MSDAPDVVIVGAGAAGIAAARALTDAGRTVLVVEAQSRLGGRAHTVSTEGMALDLGCGWLHSATRNPLAALADLHGVALDRTLSAWRTRFPNAQFANQLPEAWSAYNAFKQKLLTHNFESDVASEALASDDRWRPFLDALSSFTNGVELNGLSIQDFLAYDTAATDVNWRLVQGYGTFVANLARDLPVWLDTTVQSVTYRQDVVLETTRGRITAKAAIVTVSTNVLSSGAIRFAPTIDEHLDAAARLPLGLANKIFLSIRRPELVPQESHLLGSLNRTDTCSYYFRPIGRPIVECFLGGALARHLESAGETAAVAFVMQELSALFGASFTHEIEPLAITRWGTNCFIQGAYSHAEPGHAHARAQLATPVSERLCFAGEACSIHDFSTAHGAWQSGVEAAQFINRELR